MICILTACLFCQSTYGFSVPDLIDDPLWTKPPILTQGPSLPDGNPIDCAAQIDLTQIVGLGEVIDLTLCNNPQIKQAWVDIKIKASVVGEARGAYLPAANATYSPRQQTQTIYPNALYDANSVSNGKMAYANATWRLFDFGGRAANRASANYLLESALASHDASIQKAMAETIRNYFEVLTAKATVNAKTQLVILAKSSWDATLRRENLGSSGKSDTLQAQTAFNKAELAKSRADGDYRKAAAALIFAMGLPANTKLALQEPLENREEQELKDLNVWLRDAEEDHPAIKAAKAQWAAAKEKVTAVRAAGLPTLDFVVNFYQNGYPNQGVQATSSNTTTIGVTFNIPIFEGFITTYKIRGQQAQVENAQAELQSIIQQISGEIVKSHADAVSSLANLGLSQKLIESASASASSAVNRYNKGAADILELLNAQAAIAEANQERIRCIAEYRSARLRLLANSGVLGRNLSGNIPNNSRP